MTEAVDGGRRYDVEVSIARADVPGRSVRISYEGSEQGDGAVVTWGVAQAASILAFGGDLSLLVDGVDPEADDVDPAVDERIDIVRKAWYAATDEVDRFREHLTEVLGLSVVPSDDELRTRVAQLAGAVRHLAAGLDVPMPDLGALPVSMEALTARLREFRADVVSP